MVDVNETYVVPLGVAAALPQAEYANSYLAVVHGEHYWLVDCADNPIVRLQRAGLDPLAVRGIFITHFHPDHVYGLPAYLLGLVLLAYQRDHIWTSPLPIYARPEVLAQIKQMIALFGTQSWPEQLPLRYHIVLPQVGVTVTEDEDFQILAAPTEHSVPSMAVKFVDRMTGRAFVYSSDTFPCTAVEHLAQSATLLFHEATDSDNAHTRPADAGALASRAGVVRLVLIHYNPEPEIMASTLAVAGKTFGGPVELAESFKRYYW
ncbi:MAG: MBL fold metallo-hydrolase [Anaerolineae bacterium]|nr:MBL fold metallo-hydrolase [Anaerolineae bacterium]